MLGCGIEHSFHIDVQLKGLERPTIEGDSPVDKGRAMWNRQSSQVLSDTWNLIGIWGDHSPRLNTSQNPIVYKYREGKVKRTPGGE